MPAIAPAFSVKVNDKFWIKAISEISVNLAADLPCDNAQVTLPTPREADLSKVKKGYEIEIALGFRREKSELKTVFTGRIIWVSKTLPLVIKAEDHFSVAKETDATGTYATDEDPKAYSEVAEEVLAKAGLGIYVPQEERPGPDHKQHTFEFHKKTVAQAMARLAAESGWVYFLIPGTEEVYFGPAWPYHRGYLPQTGEAKILHFRVGNRNESWPESWGNVISSDNLKTPELYTKARCTLYDKSFQGLSVSGEYEIEGGSEEGKLHGFEQPYSFPDSEESTREQIKRIAEKRAKQELERVCAQKLFGSFTTFGNPQLSHSHRCFLDWAGEVDTNRYNGFYDARRVSFTYSATKGFRMRVEIQTPPQDLEAD